MGQAQELTRGFRACVYPNAIAVCLLYVYKPVVPFKRHNAMNAVGKAIGSRQGHEYCKRRARPFCRNPVPPSGSCTFSHSLNAGVIVPRIVACPVIVHITLPKEEGLRVQHVGPIFCKPLLHSRSNQCKTYARVTRSTGYVPTQTSS